MNQSVAMDYSPDLDSCNTLVDVLRFRAWKQPASISHKFLKDGEKEASDLTYYQLDQKARAYAAHLQALGLRGERALLLFPSGLDFIAAFFGCLYAGVIAVPAYPPRNARNLPRIESIVADAKAKVALTTDAVLTKTRSLLERAEIDLGLDYLAVDTLSEEHADDWQPPDISSDTLAFLQYTSGSTGTPKGVMVTHDNILSNLEIIRTAYNITEVDVGVGWLPLFHDMGLVGHVLAPVYAGIPSILMSPAAFLQKPVRWLRAISEHGGTISGGPNFAYDLCSEKISDEDRATLDLNNWRVAYSGAEPVRAATLEGFSTDFAEQGFRNRTFFPCYGLAEGTLMVSGGPAELPPMVVPVDGTYLEERHQVSFPLDNSSKVRNLVGCGVLTPGELPGQRLEIVNPETSKQCQPYEIGEIWVAGPHVAQGYWQKTEETRLTFEAYLAYTNEGPFLRTGDLGFVHNGNLVVTGRLKDLIIVNGRNIYPQDIEWTAERSHPALALGGGATFSVEVNNEEQLVVVQELAYRQKPDLDEVLASIRQALAEDHEIRAHEIVLIKPGSLPKTSSGKIQRQPTRTKYLAGELQVKATWCAKAEPTKASSAVPSELNDKIETSPVSPDARSKTKIKNWLITQLSNELDIPPSEIDTQQPFTYYGLASVEGVALAGKLEEWLGCIVPLSLVWDYPTIEDVSDHLCQA